MKLEMKAIKHSEFASEETYCYEAAVYVDGKPFALVGNDGHGGCDRVYPHQKFNGAFQKELRELEAYFKSLPKSDPCELFPDGLAQSFEGWCHEQVMNHLIRKDMKRDLAKGVLYMDDEKLMFVKYASYKKMTKGIASIAAQKDKNLFGKQILNLMPECDAFEAYKLAID